jgi:NAD(P)-dependent dehydrogenase (short-subunit alcohol dehydrogenase family)
MGKTVLVTGATRGIGRALVVLLSTRGYRVFASGRDAVLLASLQKETGCDGALFDLAAPDAPVALYATARAALGNVDVLVNNAGFNPGKKPLCDVSDAAMDASYALNFRAPFILCREALRDMAARGQGHIVNVISTIARTSAENYTAYCSQKHALHGFTQCLIKEARHLKVKVTGVYPGGTDTDFRPESRPDYLSAQSAAAMILHAIEAPDDTVVHELVYRPFVEANF